MSIDKTLLKRLGGKPILERVHKIFYDHLYAHAWLRPYFTDKPQKVLEDQQTDFMAFLMGGGELYAGKTPKVAHQHMVITEELFEVRQQLLSKSITQAGINDDLRYEWLAADAALKKSIVKRSAADCKVAYRNQEIIDIKNPEKK